MSANLNARNFSQPSVFAEKAQTIIPVTPSSGVAYRDPNVNPATYSNGQPFDTIVDSRIWNQLLYLCSAFAQEGEMFGFFRWSPLTDYTAGGHCTGTNGQLYIAIRASGPSLGVGARNPMDYPDYWQTLKAFLEEGGQQTSGGLIPIGMIALLPFRFNALPFGWYFCNGERYADTNLVGQALQGLPASLRLDWVITTTGNGTNVPLLIDGSGRGYFFRGVDNNTRMPGTIEQDSARPISATASSSAVTGSTPGSFSGGLGSLPTGVFTDAGVIQNTQGGTFANHSIGINLSGRLTASAQTITINQQNTGTENRPINIGMTPAIYLGV